MFNSIEKEALIGATITFDADADSEHQKVRPELPHVFVDVISLDGVGGSPVTPTVGTYNIFYRDTKNGGFKTIADNGALDATKTGGSGLADGLAIGASFSGNPLGIKVVPAGVDVAAAYRVSIRQNLS